jgi:hypothetical protein
MVSGIRINPIAILPPFNRNAKAMFFFTLTDRSWPLEKYLLTFAVTVLIMVGHFIYLWS